MDSESEVTAFDGHQVKFTLRESKDSNEILVLCHGITMDRNEWNGFFRRLVDRFEEENYSSIRFDFRGHGESSVEDMGLTVTGAIMDLESVINQIDKDKKIHILASSFGAVPSIYSCAENNIESMILICPLIETRRNYFEPEGSSFVEENLTELRKEGYITRKSGFRMSAQLMFEYRNFRPGEVLKEIEAPVLIAQGSEDSGVPPKVSKKYGTMKDNFEYVSFEGAEHGLVDPEDDGFENGTKNNWNKLEDIIIDWLEGL